MAKKKKPGADPPAGGKSAGPNRRPHRAVLVRLDLDVDAAIQAFMAGLPVRPAYKEAVQTLLREALAARGHYPHAREDSDT